MNILNVEKVSKTYGEKQLFDEVTLTTKLFIKILMMQIPVRKRPLSPHTIKMAKQVSYLSMEHMYVKI